MVDRVAMAAGAGAYLQQYLPAARDLWRREEGNFQGGAVVGDTWVRIYVAIVAHLDLRARLYYAMT